MSEQLRIHGSMPSGFIARWMWAQAVDLTQRDLLNSWQADFDRAWVEAPIDLVLPLALMRRHDVHAITRVAASWVELAAQTLNVNDPLTQQAIAVARSHAPERDHATQIKHACIQRAGKGSGYHVLTAAAYVAGLAAQRTTHHAWLAPLESNLVGMHLRLAADNLFAGDLIHRLLTYAKGELR